MQRIIPQIPHVCSGTYTCMSTIIYVNQPSEVRKHLRLCFKTLWASYKSAVKHWCPDVCLQKAIKEKDIPIEGVEFMGPNREKPDSWCSPERVLFFALHKWGQLVLHQTQRLHRWLWCTHFWDCTLLVKLLNGDYSACLSCQHHWGFLNMQGNACVH